MRASTHWQRLALWMAALAVLGTACSDDNNLGTVDEPSFALEEPLGAAILLELPEQPNRPRRQSQSIRIRSNGKAALKVTAIEWINKPEGLIAQREQKVINDCASECTGADDICLTNAGGNTCVVAGLPEASASKPLEIAAGRVQELQLYIKANVGELSCPQPDASVPEQFKQDYCGALRIKTNARNSDQTVKSGEAIVYMTSSGKSGQLRLSETFLEFTGVTPGASASRTFAVENIGSGDLTLNTILPSDFGQFFQIGGDMGVTIAPGSSRQYTLQLNVPADTAPERLDFTTNLLIDSSATNASQGTIVVRVTRSLGDVPAIAVSPAVLKFDQSASQTINIENTGSATLLVNTVSFQPSSIRKFYSLSVDGQPFSNSLTVQKFSADNPERHKKQLVVTFNPQAGSPEEVSTGTLILNHNDEAAGKTTRIIVLGDKGDVALGDVRPYNFSFDVGNAANQQRSFAILNLGTAPLTIDTVEYMALTGTIEEFQINLTTPATIPPGGLLEATALFKSENNTPDNVSARFVSNTSGELLLMSLASTQANGQPPVATIKTSFAQTAKVAERATFSAADSQPASVASSAQWALLSRPAGSSALLGAVGAQASFVPDVAGEYRVALTVNNGEVDAQEILTFQAQ